MITEIVENFISYIKERGWTQAEAAEAVGCSRQHINRIVNKSVVPSAALCAKIEEVMGKPKNTNLEACMKAYPIGNYFIQTYEWPDNQYVFDKDYQTFIHCEEAPFRSVFRNPMSGYITYIIYSPSQKAFAYLESFFSGIEGYYTNDGYTFNPYFDVQDGVRTKEELRKTLNYLPNTYENCAPTTADMRALTKKSIDCYNVQHNTDYIPCFTEQECKNFMEEK